MNKLKLSLAFLLSFCVLSISLNAQKAFNPVVFERDSLPNGLQIIYNVDKSAPVIATVVHYKVGSKDENPNRTGFAHFFEHLMFEASDNYKRGDIDVFIDEAGGENNAHTSFDETVYYFKVPANQALLPLWLESQRMRGLHVDTIGVETQRGVVKEERKQRYDNSPYGDWMERMVANLFKNGNYSWTPIGSAEHINKATIDEFKNFYNNFYQPNNAILVISGDFDIADAKKWVRDYFGSFVKAPEPVRSEFKMFPLEKEYREEIPDTKAQLPALFMGYVGPKLVDDDYYAVQLLNDILASGESSRLYQRLIDKEQAAIQAGSFPFILQNSGSIIFYGIASLGKDIKNVEKFINEEIQLIIKNGVTDEEFIKAKNISEAKFIGDKKDVVSKAEALAQFMAYQNNPDLINKSIDQLMKVTKEDIQRVAKKYLGTDKRVILTYVPSK